MKVGAADDDLRPLGVDLVAGLVGDVGAHGGNSVLVEERAPHALQQSNMILRMRRWILGFPGLLTLGAGV